MKKSYLLILSIVCVVAASTGFLFSRWYLESDDKKIADPSLAPPSVLNTPMPNFSLMDPDGILRSNTDFKDHVLVVNFWATWCAPCLDEIPIFTGLQTEYRAQGVRFVGIALDNRTQVLEFMASTPMNYSVLLGGAEGINLGKHFGNQLGVLPFTAIVDRQGIIVYTHFGAMTRNAMKPIIQSLL